MEDARRLRWQRLDAGDELAALNLVPPSSATRGAGARPVGSGAHGGYGGRAHSSNYTGRQERGSE